MRIGVFGGSFDPPHRGHLKIARTARKQLRLHRILFVPAYVPPHKRRGTTASPTERLAMVRLAVKNKGLGFRASDIEVKRKGISYTAQTLKRLKRMFPRAEFYLLIGSDNAMTFHTWKSARDIARDATLAIYRRDGGGQVKHLRGVRTVALSGRVLDISSSEIRSLIRQGRSVRQFLPAAVLRFIRTRRLYQRK